MVAETSPLSWCSLISWLSLLQKKEIDDNSVESLLRLIHQNPQSFKSFIRNQRAETFPYEEAEAPEFKVEEDEVGTAMI